MSEFYHAPEDSEVHRLEKFAMVSQPMSYAFDMFGVWRDPETDKLYYGHDSGCSCPSPFENIGSLSDLNELNNINEFIERLGRWNFYGDDGRPEFVIKKSGMRTKVANYLRTHNGI
jgi:hypothetical protein